MDKQKKYEDYLLKEISKEYIKVFRPYYKGCLIKCMESGVSFQCLVFCNIDHRHFDFYIDDIVRINPSNFVTQTFLDILKNDNCYNGKYEELRKKLEKSIEFKSFAKHLRNKVKKIQEIEKTYPNFLQEYIIPQLGK